jgi:gas vesicle protein
MNKLLAGIAIGVAIGVLIAPDKGTATRKKLADKGRELKDQFNDFVDSWSEKLEALKGEAEEIAVTAQAQPYSA